MFLKTRKQYLPEKQRWWMLWFEIQSPFQPDSVPRRAAVVDRRTWQAVSWFAWPLQSRLQMNAGNGPSGQRQVSGKGLQGCHSTYCPDNSTNQLIDPRPNLQREESSKEISMKMTRIHRNERVPEEKPRKKWKFSWKIQIPANQQRSIWKTRLPPFEFEWRDACCDAVAQRGRGMIEGWWTGKN